MRIFDRVASGESVHLMAGALEPPTDLQIVWRRATNTAVRIVADEAAQFIFQSNRDDWSINKASFGIMRPPFDNCWIEWLTPSHRLIDGAWHFRGKSRVAAHMILHDDGGLWFEVLFGDRANRPLVVAPFTTHITGESDPDNAHERVSLYAGKEILRDKAGLSADIDLATSLATELWPAYLTLGWLNCRNVSTTDVTVNARIAAKRQRRGQPRGLDYKRIVLDEGTQRALTVNRDAEQHGKRLHIVRGHIKHYTPERPLFGKYTGNYWWHQQMRGNADLGRINHEYHVASRGPR